MSKDTAMYSKPEYMAVFIFVVVFPAADTYSFRAFQV